MGNKLKRIRRQQTPLQIGAPLNRTLGEESFKWSRNQRRRLRATFMGHNIKHVATELQFYESLEKELNQSDINNLRNVFNLTRLTLSQTAESMHFWMNDNLLFSRIYTKEFERYISLCYEEEDITAIEHVGVHCKGALLTHVKLVENLKEPQKLDRILKHIAASHIFLNKTLVSVKKHDESLARFIKHEFQEYVDKNTIHSIHKYFRLISGRLQTLLHMYLKERSIQNMIESMNSLKILINSNESTEEMQSIYTNSQECMESYCLLGLFEESTETIF